MNEKLKELTDKIYSEGVEKAENKAAEILENAQKEADRILKKSEQEADNIVDSAKKDAADLKKNVESEIKLAARQSINALKQQITELIITESNSDEINSVLKDKDFVKNVIEKIITGSQDGESAAVDISLVLSENERAEMEQYFNAKFKDIMNKGLEVKFSERIQSGFEIGPKDNTYKISFTDEAFEVFFKNYLKPRSIKLLYEE